MKKKVKFNKIFKNERGFDSDLFSIDIIYLNEKGEVDFAKRIFRIASPKWLIRAVFYNCPNLK